MDKQNRAARKKHHIIYKTTCLITGRYYIGMHSTDDLNDGYIGSGKRLWRSIKKHGAKQHVCEVLEHLPSRITLLLREAELVNEQLLKDELCMNLVAGGGGGSFEKHSRACKLALSNYTKQLWQDPNYRALVIDKISEGMKNAYLDSDFKEAKRVSTVVAREIAGANGVKDEWIAKQTQNRWSDEQKIKQGQTMAVYVGKSNPSFGNPWIYHPDLKKNKKVKAVLLDEHLMQGWVKGRKSW